MSAHYFISDAHLGAAPAETEARLVGFLSGLEGRADTLWILGDLFDFWFEYGRAIPRHGFRVLTALGRLREAGTEITILAGNHDLRFSGFLERTLGINTADQARPELDRRRVLMRHGDEIDRRFISRLFRTLMKSRVNNALYRLIHPDLGIGLAGWVARRSRNRPADPQLAERMREYARGLLRQGNEIVIFGHLHRPELSRFPEGSYLNTGDWLHNFSYGVLRDGELALERYDPGAPRRVLRPRRCSCTSSGRQGNSLTSFRASGAAAKDRFCLPEGKEAPFYPPRLWRGFPALCAGLQ